MTTIPSYRFVYWCFIVVWSGLCSFLGSSTPAFAQGSSGTFELGFDAPTGVSAESSRADVEFGVSGTLGTSVSGEDGAQGWTIGITANGCTIAAATTAGTAGDLEENGGFRKAGSSFEHTELTTGAGNVGAVSGVALSFLEEVSLPATGGPHTLLALTLQATAPSIPGQCNQCTLSYVDGLQGSGQPAENEITYQKQAVVPTLTSETVDICTNAFELGFDAPIRVGTETPGGTAEFEVPSTLETRVNGGTGAEGWTLGITSAGCSIVDATTDGTAGDLEANGGHRKPGDGFEFTKITSGAGNSGVVSGVVLAFSEDASLPPGEGPHTLLRVTVQAASGGGPGECTECTLSYVDNLVGSGEPIDNEITYQNQSIVPTTRAASVDVCSNAFEVSFDAPETLRTNGTTDFDVSSVLHSSLPGNEGASAWEIGVAAEGCRIASATTVGSVADVTTNGGLRNPDSSFEFTEITTGAGNEGVVSGVILSFTDDVTLDPNDSPHTLLNITVEDTPPNDGSECAPCTLSYVDGLDGSGQSVANQITFMSQAFPPTRESSTTDICRKPFALDLEGPDRVTSRNGSAFDVTSVLTTTGTNAGAESWSVGIVSNGCTIASATTTGTAADVETHGGFRRSDDGGFELTELTGGSGSDSGVVSSVVLSSSGAATLPPGGSPHTVLSVNVEADAPEKKGACTDCSLTYQDGLIGSDGSVNNRVTNANGSSTPSLSGHTTEICAVAYEFDFDGPARIQGQGGVDFNVSSRLVTTPDADVNANGWTLGIVADGCSVTGATTAGTVADLESNGGLRKSGDDGFELTELTSGDGNEGVVSSVVLSFSEASSLDPAASPHTILDLSLEAVAPGDHGECSECTLAYNDGLTGSGGVIDNTVRVGSSTFQPRVSSQTVEFCSVPYEFSFFGPDRVTTADTVGIDVSTILITTSNASQGAHGWSIGVAATGCTIARATTNGTVGDVVANGGLRQPGDDGFELTELIDGPDGSGVISTVTLSIPEDVTLAPQDSPHTLLNLSIEVDAPTDGGECQACTLDFVDGLAGSGDPVVNQVDLANGTSTPRLSSKTIDVCTRVFSLGFDTPERLDAVENTEFEANGVLTSDVGTPNGWTLGIVADGCSVTGATTAGTVADLESNGGLRKSGDDGFELTELTSGDGNEGVVSSVVLSFSEASSLDPAASPHIIVKLTVEAEVADGQTGCLPCALSYLDGLTGSTGPIDNEVKYGDESFVPELGLEMVDVCVEAGGQVPGDVDQDGGTDVSDTVRLLGFLFLANPRRLPCEFGSDEIPGFLQLSDWNGDQQVDISDAISNVLWLFRDGKPHVANVLNEDAPCVVISGCPNVCP